MHPRISKSIRRLFLPLAAVTIGASALIGIGGSHAERADADNSTFLVEFSYQTIQFPLVFDNGHFGATAEAFGYMRTWATTPATGAMDGDGVRDIATGEDPAVCEFLPAAWGWSSMVMPSCRKDVEAGPTYHFADVAACRESSTGDCAGPYKQHNNTFQLHVHPGDKITASLVLFDDDNSELTDDLCQPSKVVGGYSYDQLMSLDNTYTMAQGFNGTASCIVTFRVRTVQVPVQPSQPPAPGHR